MANMALGKASATSVLQTQRSDIPDGRLWVTPAYYQTDSDDAVQLNAANDWIAARIVPQTDFLITSISRYVTAVGTQGDGTLSVYSDTTSCEPNGDLNGSSDKCHEDQTDNSTPLTVAATSESGTDYAYKAMDGSLSTQWTSGADPAVTPQEHEIDFGVGNEKCINKLRITAANEALEDNRAYPKTFTIQLHNGSSYSTFSTVSTSTDPGQALTAEYTFTNAAAMQKAKLNITDNHGANAYVRIGELEWIEAEEVSAPNVELQELGTLSSGDTADVWTRLAVATNDQYQAQRGIPIWLVMKGAASADWSESIRRYSQTPGSAFPDEMNLCKTTTDGGTTWTQALQDDVAAMWNMVVNSVADKHVPQLCYGRWNGKYIYLPGVGMKEIPEEGSFYDCSGLTAGVCYNGYVYHDGSGLQLDVGTTVQTTYEGVLVKTGATSRRFIGTAEPDALISTYVGPVDVKDNRGAGNTDNTFNRPFAKYCPYVSNTNETTNNTDWWASPNGDGDDFLIRCCCAGPRSVSLRAIACPSNGAKYHKVGIGIDEKRPFYDDTGFSGTQYVNIIARASVVLSPGSHQFWPLLKSSAIGATWRHVLTVRDNEQISLVGWLEC